MLRSLRFVALTAAIPCVVAAQSDQTYVQHYDGTTEATSRGGGGTAEKGLFQRLPGDQICGRTAINGFAFVIQDQDYQTGESYMIEVRKNNSNASGTPDISPAGLLGSIGPINITFPMPPSGIIVAVGVVQTFMTPLALPAETGSSPADDIYVGMHFLPNALWPNDAISLHASGTFFAQPSVGEQMRATAVGYAGLVGEAGLGWDVNFTTLTAVVATGNRAWNIATQFVDDVLQPLASNPAVFTGIVYNGVAGTGTGLNPNYGYAGIFPDTVRGDQPGFTVGANTGGGVAVGILGNAGAPIQIPGIAGRLCLNPLSMVFLPSVNLTPTGGMGTGSFATFGPYGVGILSGNLYAQVVIVDNLFNLSLSLRICINF